MEHRHDTTLTITIKPNDNSEYPILSLKLPTESREILIAVR
jgi:hypothetical protein